MKLLRTSTCAVLVGTLIMLAFPAVVAYPILEDGHDSYDPPPYYPPTTPPPTGPPPIPTCGYFTVDCPSGGWTVDFVNVYDEYACVHRLGPASWCYCVSSNYSSLARGWFPDSSQAYGWPAQTMPIGNSSIMSVYLVVVAKVSNYQVLPPYPSACLQYSIDGQENYYPALYSSNATFSIYNYTEYQVCLFNVTTYQNWTPQMLLSQETFVRVHITSAEVVNPVLVDYVGLRYNWTFLGAPDNPIWDWENSTLGQLSNASLLIGALGTIGFIGMIVAPAVGIMMARHAEDRGAVIGKAALAMLACFALFWMAIH